MLECKICGTKFNAIIERHYIARDNGKTGLAVAFGSTAEESLYDTFDVAMMMALLKIARIRTGTATNDSYVDLAGYAACGAEINSKN